MWVDHAATQLTVLLDKGALSGTLVADVVTVRMEDSAVTLSGGVSRLTLSARGDSEVGIDHLRGSRVVLELHDDAVARVSATSSQLNYRVHGAAGLYYDAATELGSVRERNGNAEVRVEELDGG